MLLPRKQSPEYREWILEYATSRTDVIAGRDVGDGPGKLYDQQETEKDANAGITEKG